MLYYFGYGLMWMAFRIFFRRIMVVNKEKLNRSSPTIIIANHPASFLDAMVLAVFLGRPIHFYVRGDIFSHPLARWVLSQFHMIPIYSIEHGLDNLGKNKRTFERGQRLLNNGNMLLIFPEGFSRFSKELAPFKKGAARVALQTAFDPQFKGELIVQTVSINYSYHGFRSILHIRIGESMGISEYRESYLITPNHAIAALNKAMMNLFERNVIHIKQGERTSTAESLLRISVDHENDSELYFSRSQQVCGCISNLDEDQFKLLTNQIEEFNAQLHQYNVGHEALKNQSYSLYLKSIFLLLLAPLALVGFSCWHIIYVTTKWIADKTVTREDFYTSVFCGILGVLGLIWHLLILVIALFIESNSILFIVLVSPFLYMLFLRWREEVRNIRSVIRLNGLMFQDKTIIENLTSARAALSCID